MSDIPHSQQLYERQLASYNHELQRGVVLASIPQLSLYLVRPAGTYGDQYIVCSAPTAGSAAGTACFSIPQVQTEVLFAQDANGAGKLLTAIPCAVQVAPYIEAMQTLGGLQDSDYNLLDTWDKYVQIAINASNSKYSITTTGACLDTYAGDFVVADKYGGKLLVGRAQITIKGSALAYTEYSAVTNKITTVAVNWQLDTLGSLHLYQTDIQRHLNAYDARQSLGLVSTSRADQTGRTPLQYTLKNQAVTDISWAEDSGNAVYRQQEFIGGAVHGTVSVTLIPSLVQEQAQLSFPALEFSHTDYQGNFTHITANSTRSIKAFGVPCIQQLRTTDIQKALKQGEAHKRVQIPQAAATQVPILLQALLNAQAGVFVDQMYTQAQIQSMYKAQIEPYGRNLKQLQVDLKDPVETSSQQLKGGSYIEVEDTPTGKIFRLYNNSSFITQEPDGSVFIKDGWGSEIRMTGGNIIISSALDTFIRPGRDLVALVPRHLQATANAQLVLASKESCKLASQGDVKLASGCAGAAGMTVIQNRSNAAVKSASGIIVRSNSDVCLTASRDIVIGCNDKTQENLEEAVKASPGAILIHGGNISVQSQGHLKLAGSYTGLYSYSTDSKKGTGLQLTPSVASLTGRNIMLDTCAVVLGKSSSYGQAIAIFNSQKSFVLDNGDVQQGLVVKGQIRSKGITCDGGVYCTGQSVARQYAVLYGAMQFIIPPVPEWQAKDVRKSIQDAVQITVSPVNLYMPKPGPVWYTDNHICSNQLQFATSVDLGFAGIYKMPSMCWQVQDSTDTPVFQPVITFMTGNSENPTYSYPGYNGWTSGLMSSIDKEFKVDYTIPLFSGYKTNK